MENKFMYTHSFDEGTEVIFTQLIKTQNYALTRKNRVYSEITKGTKGVVMKVMGSGFGAGDSTSYTVAISDGRTVAAVPEYALDFA